MEQVNSYRPGIELLGHGLSSRRDLELVGDKSTCIGQGDSRSTMHHLCLAQESSCFIGLGMAFTEHGEGRESRTKLESGVARSQTHEDFLYQLWSGDGRHGGGQRNLGCDGTGEKLGIEDSITTLLGAVHKEGMCLREVGVGRDIAEVVHTRGGGSTILVGEGLDTTGSLKG